jgi:formylglycine-generating enzyme required for sulfatase activity
VSLNASSDARATEQAAGPDASPLTPVWPDERRLPRWVWVALGAVALTFVAAVLFNLLRGEPGFTLVVRGAAQGSDVYVDQVRRGVSQADGTIRVAGLKPGQRAVRVAHDGYTDFNTTVSGEDGAVRTIVAQLRRANTDALPSEIDYNGAMVLVPAGEFVMGDDNAHDNERPAHRVALPAFYIDKFEVTNEQYKKFCDETGHNFPTNPWWDGQYFTKNPRLPVLGVSWNDATAYAAWARKRLPTEEEWEKAAAWDAKAQRKRQWPWGDARQRGRAVLGMNRPAPIGQTPTGASPYGAQDMAGNVLEWVDAYYQPYAGNPTTEPTYGTQYRVARGGHFGSSLDDARTARRFYSQPEFTAADVAKRSWLIGFRCAVAADDAALQEHLSARGR